MKIMARIIITILSTNAMAADLAKIGGKGFSDEQFRQELSVLGHQAEMIKANPEFRKKFLNHIIDNKLLAAEATREKLFESEEFRIKLAAAKRDLLANQFFWASEYTSISIILGVKILR